MMCTNYYDRVVPVCGIKFINNYIMHSEHYNFDRTYTVL